MTNVEPQMPLAGGWVERCDNQILVGALPCKEWGKKQADLEAPLPKSGNAQLPPLEDIPSPSCYLALGQLLNSSIQPLGLE